MTSETSTADFKNFKKSLKSSLQILVWRAINISTVSKPFVSFSNDRDIRLSAYSVRINELKEAFI